MVDWENENFPNISAEGRRGIRSAAFGIGERRKGAVEWRSDSVFYRDDCWSG